MNEEGAYSDLATAGALRGSPLGRLDRALVTELVSGSVKRRYTLDWVLSRYLAQGLAQTPPWTRNILRLAAYQLLFLDRIPAAAACDTAVELAKKYAPRTAGLVNAVLRRLAREGWPALPRYEDDPVAHLAVKHAHPPWLVARWLARWGREWTEALCRADNERPPLALRVNTLKQDAVRVQDALRAAGAAVRPSAYVPEGLIGEGLSFLEELEGLREGWFLFQDEGSMLVSHAVAPAAESLIVDACAGVGTKTTHLAQLTGDRGEVLAVDLRPAKLKLLEENCRRLGIGSVRPLAADARELPGLLPRPANYLLVDAPCSGFGVLRRRADARWRKSPEQLRSLPRLQLELLEAAYAALKPGGVLVYSTCTTEPEENEEVVAEICARHRDLRAESLEDFLPRPLPREEDRRLAAQGQLRLYPHVHGTDGFFIARLRKA